MWAFLLGIVPGLLGIAGKAGDAVSSWSERQDKLAQAKLDTQLAEETARQNLAAYRVKSETEWDLKWADQASTSWKDEWLLILWSVPTIMLFIPGWPRQTVMEGFDYLKAFNPDAPSWFMAGWAIIFAATFGIKQALQFMLPSRLAGLAKVMGSLPDDIPPEAADRAAQQALAQN